MDKGMPLISVIVPVYNVGLYIKKCLESIEAQTYPNIEIIAVDDASIDEGGRICDVCANGDGRLKVVHFSVNKGPSAARNEGIRIARGEFVSFIDGDDYVEPDLIEKLYRNMKENSANISICGADGIKLPGGPASLFSAREAVWCLAKGIPFNHVPWGKLYEMELVKKHPFDETVFCSEDILFLYHVFQDAERVSYLPDKLYHYVNREGSQVHSGMDERKCTALFVNDILCKDALENYPEMVSDFRYFALDTNIRFAIIEVKIGKKGKESLGYLNRLRENTRCHFSWRAISRCRRKRDMAMILVLYMSGALFLAMADVWYGCRKILGGGED